MSQNPNTQYIHLSSKVILGIHEGIVEDEQISPNFRDPMDALETDTYEYVDFLGVDSFTLQANKNYVDLVNLLAFGLNSFWAKRLAAEDNWYCSRRIKYSKYLFLWSGKVQFQGQSSIDSLCKRRFCLDSFHHNIGIRGQILLNLVELMQENDHKCSRMVRYSKYLFVWKGRIQFSHGVFDDDDLDSRTSLFQPGEFDAGASIGLSKEHLGL
jgi:hypothetical protein